MKYTASKTTSNSRKRRSWRELTGAVTVIILLVSIAAALSKQGGQAQKAPARKAPTQKAPAQTTPAEARRPEIAKQGDKTYVTSDAAGQTVASTGRRARYAR